MNLDDTKAKLRKAYANLNASHCLKPGRHRFIIREAAEKRDDQRKYNFVYIRLESGGKMASDRFKVTDEKGLGKLNQLLLAVGLEATDQMLERLDDGGALLSGSGQLDSSAWKGLVGKSGDLNAVQKGDQTFYNYLPR